MASMSSTSVLTGVVLVVIVGCVTGRTLQGCLYDGVLHHEGVSVLTEEPCLSCRCLRGTLVCSLKVCPELPSPPPSGCIVLHRKDDCCSQLICSDGKLRQAEISEHDISDQTTLQKGSGCIMNGTSYAEGSAMSSSSLCEYCYCIRGRQQCVKPKCVLEAAGCEPTFIKHKCCPANYVCTRKSPASSADEEVTTTLTSGMVIGCTVDDMAYEEGAMISSVASSICENCFCVQGRVRCVPLASAPPLQGCNPIVKAGECWPASYNCSGTTMDVQMTENDFILRNVVGERKFPSFVRSMPEETKQAPISVTEEFELSVEGRANKKPANKVGSNTKVPKNVTTVTTEKYTSTTAMREMLSTNKPKTISINNKNSQSNSTASKNSVNINIKNVTKEINITTSTTTEQNIERTTETLTTDAASETEFASTNTVTWSTTDSEANNLTLADRDLTTIEEEQNITVTESYTTPEENMQTTEVEFTFPEKSTSDTESYTLMTTFDTLESVTITMPISSSKSKTTPSSEIKERIGTNSSSYNIFGLLDVKDNDNLNSKEELETRGTFAAGDLITMEATTELAQSALSTDMSNHDVPTAIIMAGDQFEVNVTMHSNLSIKDSNKTGEIVTAQPPPLRSIAPDIENITNKKDEDYELYDYNDPSLPPSLPNLRIIPFVAADAVLEKADEMPKNYQSKENRRPTDNPAFYKVSHPNLFSPPIETEGGFLPREPIIDGPFYESKFDMTYHTTKQNGVDHLPLEITTNSPITPQSITMPPNSKDGSDNCISDGHDYHHGETMSTPEACIMCVCYFGEIHCHPPKCPSLKTGCRRIKENDHMSCCGRIICDEEESPTVVVLDRIDITMNPLQQPSLNGGNIPPVTVAEGVDIPDPFRDVIRTEAAPDLPSLINDMKPYLLERHSTTPAATTSTTTPVPSLWAWNVSSAEPEAIQERTTSTTTTPITSSTMRTTTSSPSPTYQHKVNFPTSPPMTTTTMRTTTSSPSPTYQHKVNVPTSPPMTTTKVIEDETEKEEEDNSFSFDSVLQLLFSGGDEPTKPPPPSTTRRTTTTTSTTEKYTTPTTSTTHHDNHLDPTRQPIDRIDENINNNVHDNDPELVIENPSDKSGSESLLTSTSHRPDIAISESPPGRPPNLKRPVTGDPVAASGLLKLAGCNIYGRMYRVGRVISELSGPCLECMCTEIGVQCRPLSC